MIDPWKRIRLLLCLAAMIAMLVPAATAWVLHWTPHDPFGHGRMETPYVIRGWVRNAANPFDELESQFDAARLVPPILTKGPILTAIPSDSREP